MLNKLLKAIERMSTERAAKELYRLGYKDIARKILMESK